MRKGFCVVGLFVLAGLILLTGCQAKQKAKQYDWQLPPGELALRKITNPADIPDFTQGGLNTGGLSIAIENSLDYLNKPSSKQFFPYGDITHEHAKASLKAFKKLLDSGLRGKELDQAIREQFDVYISVGCDYKGTVLFTGYYTPIFDGSTSPTEKYKYPLYKQPEDLVKGPNGEIRGQKGADGQIKPYPARAEIENSQMLKGKELVWLSNPFEVYIANVQGSAKIRMPDGSLTTIGYAANNGHDYRSVADAMVADGKIPKDQMSLSAMIAYFKEHADLVPTYTQHNPRFVFFRMADSSPRGSLNEPVTPMKSIATDKSIYPRACPAFLSTTLPRLIGDTIYHDPYDSFVLDQDTGGAIRAPGRCDIYMGEGDKAGKLAGHTKREGKLYYIFVKPEYQQAALAGDPQAKPAPVSEPAPQGL